MTYNHAFTIAFSVPHSTDPEGMDVMPQQYRAALLKRLEDLVTYDQWQEAVGAPCDTYQEEDTDGQ